MMYRIGEFSKLGKVSTSTLRYYDEIGILKPSCTDRFNRYRSYAPEQLRDLCSILRYREAGLSLEDIREIVKGGDPGPVLERNLERARKDLEAVSDRISILNELMTGPSEDRYRVEVKELPKITTAYRKGRIDRYSDMSGFVLEFAGICESLHPDLECTDDGECFIIYDDIEYREEDIGLTYHQVVTEAKESSEEIGFMTFDPVLAITVKHLGPYNRLNEAYAAITEWMEVNDMEPTGQSRECYIHGCWDTEDESEYLTEVQIPIGHR